MNEYKLLLLPGDGIGPEVLDATMRVVGWYGQKGLPYKTVTELSSTLGLLARSTEWGEQ